MFGAAEQDDGVVFSIFPAGLHACHPRPVNGYLWTDGRDSEASGAHQNVSAGEEDPGAVSGSLAAFCATPGAVAAISVAMVWRT